LPNRLAAMIESPHNQLVKTARSLHDRKGRELAGLFLAEGPSVVAEALAYAPGIEWIAWCPALGDETGRELVDAARGAGLTLHEMSERAFTALSDARSPQGIAAVLQIRASSLNVVRPEGDAVFLVLHEVRDPGNLGTMIRTADALGAQAVVLCGKCVDQYEPKVVRATAGSLFHLPVVEATWRQTKSWAEEHEIVLAATSLDATLELGLSPLPSRLALVIGNEAHGLPDEVLQDARLRVRIPMRGRAESLNAAVAAAIVLYEASRDRD